MFLNPVYRVKCQYKELHSNTKGDKIGCSSLRETLIQVQNFSFNSGKMGNTSDHAVKLWMSVKWREK